MVRDVRIQMSPYMPLTSSHAANLMQIFGHFTPISQPHVLFPSQERVNTTYTAKLFPCISCSITRLVNGFGQGVFNFFQEPGCPAE